MTSCNLRARQRFVGWAGTVRTSHLIGLPHIVGGLKAHPTLADRRLQCRRLILPRPNQMKTFAYVLLSIIASSTHVAAIAQPSRLSDSGAFNHEAVLSALSHFSCTQLRWGRMSLPKNGFGQPVFRVIEDDHGFLIQMDSDIISGNRTDGMAYLEVRDTLKHNLAVRNYEYIASRNSSDYASYKLKLFGQIRTHIYPDISQSRCRRIYSNSKTAQGEVRLARKSLMLLLHVSEVEYAKFMVCNFVDGDPYAVALVRTARGMVTAYTIDITNATFNKISGEADLLTAVAPDISPQVALRRCGNW